ncbi:MAG: hypothetical protein LBL94_09700, partial [Prevotellaceae bacterium]|nr:hypothetical protein [Prevotellaceae bacterium]
TDHTAIYFYQHFVPNGTKIERKYFYVNITFLTPHPTGCQQPPERCLFYRAIHSYGMSKNDNLKYTQ